MIAFARECVSDVEAEIRPLLDAHYAEIAHYQDIPLLPDWAFYRAAKTVRVFTARDQGDLFGYAVFFVAPNRHYTSSVQALQDILFIHPDYRGALLGRRFIDWCDQQLKAEGAQVVYQHVKKAHDFGPLLKSIGYEEVETIWARRLDKE